MSERDDIAKAFHNIYLVTAKAFGWPVRPDVDVEFEHLSKDAQELDYALADFHLAEIARLRAEVDFLKTAKELCDNTEAYNIALGEIRELKAALSKCEAVVRAVEETYGLWPANEKVNKALAAYQDTIGQS